MSRFLKDVPELRKNIFGTTMCTETKSLLNLNITLFIKYTIKTFWYLHFRHTKLNDRFSRISAIKHETDKF